LEHLRTFETILIDGMRSDVSLLLTALGGRQPPPILRLVEHKHALDPRFLELYTDMLDPAQALYDPAMNSLSFPHHETRSSASENPILLKRLGMRLNVYQKETDPVSLEM
jgi:hypothetical protein